MSGNPLTISFEHSPTAYAAAQSDAVVCGIMGPFGSGKSVGGVTGMMMNAMMQEPSKKDNIRYSRWAVVRGTTPELRATTIKTFVDQFPEGPHGRVVFSSPITYHIKFPPMNGQPGMDCEIVFLGLDKPKDIKKLLSLEITGAFVNEARELPETIVDGITGRIGRYPAGDKGKATKPCVYMDTNPPDTDSWWYRKFELGEKGVVVNIGGKEYDLSWRGYKQPPAVLELKKITDDRYDSLNPMFKYSFKANEVIPAGDTYWGVNPEAENLPHLPPAYYHTLIANKSKEFINVYAAGEYGYVADGKPVVPEFIDSVHADEFPILADRPLVIGVDIGGGTLQPAAAIMQRSPLGVWLCQGECIGKDMGVDRFADQLEVYLQENFPGLPIHKVYTDPAAEKRDEIFETKVNDFLVSKGFPVEAAPTNNPGIRRLAIAQPCNRMVMGKPGLLVHKTRAPNIRKGLGGKWNFRKIQVSGSEKYAETPDKNEYSHPCDALGYALSGGGEANPVKKLGAEQSNNFNAGFSMDQGFDLF